MSGVRGDAAFPLALHLPGEVLIQPGMTLRDYFAGQALAGILAHQHGTGIDYAWCAETSYKLADAMMKARQP